MKNLSFGSQTTGVYAIVETKTGQRYIGSTQFDFEHRWNEHRRDLKKNKHTSPLLQKAFNKFGLTGLKFEVILICEPYECIRYEQYFMDYWRNKNKLLNANRIIEWDFSNRGDRGYTSPRIAYERRVARREHNKLSKALREHGYSFDEAERIAEKIFPFPGFIKDEDLL